VDVEVGFAGAAIGNEEGDKLPVLFPEIGNILQARVGAVQANVPAGIIEPGDVPAPFMAAVEQEDLAQKGAHGPEIIFGLVRAEGGFHSSPFLDYFLSYSKKKVFTTCGSKCVPAPVWMYWRASASDQALR
jgi:hypothetical protein